MRESEIGRRLGSLQVAWVTVFLFSVTVLAFSQKEPDPWLLKTNVGNNALNSHTTHEDLIRVFGVANLEEQDGIDGMSGDTEYGTVIFPKDTERTIEILWQTSDKKVPIRLTIRGQKSKWKADRGISLGTSLNELEQLNGRSFRLTGFAWDYSGTITSWEGGSLDSDLQAPGGVVLRLDAPMDKLTEAESRQIQGDGEFSSRHPIMKKLNPRVYEIVWSFL
jgi:hypothetical protein